MRFQTKSGRLGGGGGCLSLIKLRSTPLEVERGGVLAVNEVIG